MPVPIIITPIVIPLFHLGFRLNFRFKINTIQVKKAKNADHFRQTPPFGASVYDSVKEKVEW